MDDNELLSDEEYSRRARRGCLFEFFAFLAILFGPFLVLIFCISKGIVGDWAICAYFAVVFLGLLWEIRNFGGYNPSTALYDD